MDENEIDNRPLTRARRVMEGQDLRGIPEVVKTVMRLLIDYLEAQQQRANVPPASPESIRLGPIIDHGAELASAETGCSCECHKLGLAPVNMQTLARTGCSYCRGFHESVPADPRPEPAHVHAWRSTVYFMPECDTCGAISWRGKVYIPEAPHER